MPPMMGAPGMPPTMGAPGMHGDTAALRACKQIKPRGNKGKLRNKKNCFRDLAKSLGAKQSARAEWKRCKQIRPKGKLGKLRNKKNCFRDLARSLQHGPPTGAPGMPPMGDASMAPPMAPPMGAPAITGKRPGGKMGNYGCGQPNRRKHVNCLRRLLDTTPHGATVRKGTKGLGKYGCGDKNRRKHVNCLRRLLDKHGPQLVGQGRKMSKGKPGKQGKLGNYGCGQKNRKKHVNCLRDLLGTTPLFDKVRHRKEGNKTRGLYGCSGLKQGNWKKHTKCLRRLLDKHGPHLAKGKRGMAPGTN